MKTTALLMLGLLALAAAIHVTQHTGVDGSSSSAGPKGKHGPHAELHELEHEVTKADHDDVHQLKHTLDHMSDQVRKTRIEDAEHFQKTKLRMDNRITALVKAIKHVEDQIKETTEHQTRSEIQKHGLDDELKRLAKQHADTVADLARARRDLATVETRFRHESARLTRVTAKTEKLQRTLQALVHKLHHGKTVHLVEVQAVAAAVAARDRDNESVRDVVQALHKDNASACVSGCLSSCLSSVCLATTPRAPGS